MISSCDAARGDEFVRLYYGWYIVAVALVVNTLTVGATFMAFGLFVVPVSKALELSRAEMNTAIILLSLGMAVTAPFVGRAIDRFPLKMIMIPSALLFGGSLVALGLSESVWLSAAIIAFPLAIGMSGAGPLAVTTLVARWFAVRRGRAMSIATIGGAFGSVVVVPPLGIAIEQLGWRAALVGMGATLIVLLLVLALFVLDRPGADDHETAVGERPSRRCRDSQ
jgi:MFS family permease